MTTNISTLLNAFTASQPAPSGPLSIAAQASALAQNANITLLRLPEQILKLTPTSSKGASSGILVKQPEGQSISTTAQFTLSKTGPQPSAPGVLFETTQQHTSSPVGQQQIQAIVGQLSRLAPAQILSQISVPATVESQSSQTLTLQLQGNKAQKITLPVKLPPNTVSRGDAVQVTLDPIKPGTWKLEITPSPTSDARPATAIMVAQLSTQIPSQRQVLEPILQQQLRQTGITTTVALLQNAQPELQSTATAPLSTTSLKLDNQQLQVFTQTARAIGQLIANPQTTPVIQNPSTPTIPVPPAQLAELPVLNADDIPSTNQEKVKLSTTSVPDKSNANATVAQAASQPRRTNPTEQAIAALPKHEIQQQIVQLSRQLLAQTGSTQQALQQLVRILSNADIPLSDTSAQLKAAVVKQLSDITLPPSNKVPSLATDATIPANTEPGDKPSIQQPQLQQAQALQSLLQATTLPVTPVSLTTPPATSGFISGLVALLQVSLAGRAIRQQPNLAKAVDNAESVIAKSVSNLVQTSTSPPPSRVATEFAQLDARFNLIAQLKTLFAGHQQQKLANADSRLQGQESLYYVLPVTNDKQAPTELLIKREEREHAENQAQQSALKRWHITMKLDIGDVGQLLAKSRINGDVIELNLYTSTDALLTQVSDTLPYLLRRFSALGLTVESSSVQRGKIPQQLQDRPYHIFEAMA